MFFRDCPGFGKRAGWPLLIMLIWAGLTTLTGCAVGPDYVRPQVPVPNQWVGPAAAEPKPLATPDENRLARWWEIFADARLTSLIERAVQANLNVKQAEARILQARAVRGGTEANLAPTLDAKSSFRRTQSPGTTTQLAGKTIESGPTINNQYQAGFDAGWELDIFGGVRRSIEAAQADLEAALESRRDILVTLTAEVARNYLELRTFQARSAITAQNLAAQKQSAGLTRQRFQAGFVSGLDVAGADAQVATTSAQLPLLEAAARQSIYTLSLLLGREPGALMEELSPGGRLPKTPPAVPAGIPSDLLLRRPDIRRAEAALHAATARIGVATADLFPKFMISGSAGYQATDTSSLFNVGSQVWSFGPSISWRLFDLGRVRANIKQKEALQEESLLSYRQTVLTALQDVENALISSTKEQERYQRLAEAVAANRKAVDLAKTLYINGQTDFINVLQSQQALYATEDALTQSTKTLSTNLVALYKALGGGWGVDQEARPAPAAEIKE